MSEKARVNCAEVIDRMNRGVAWGMLICGITYFLVAAEKLVEPGRLNSSLDIASGVGVAITMLITMLACYPAVKMKLSGKFLLGKEPESFLTDAMHNSFKNSWLVTMMFLVLVLAFQSKIDELQLETSFYFIVLFGFMASSAAVSFFIITRSDELDDVEEQ